MPVDFLGQAVVLDALVSPASRSQGEDDTVPFSRKPALSSGNGGQGGGGRRRGAGGDFATRLDGLFALSRWVERNRSASQSGRRKTVTGTSERIIFCVDSTPLIY